MISKNDHSQLMMKSLLRYLVNCKILNEWQSDTALWQYNSFDRDGCKINADKIKSKDCLDDFYFNWLQVDKYKEPGSVVKIFFTISHKQSSVERSFSLIKQFWKTIFHKSLSNHDFWKKIIWLWETSSHTP